MSRTISSLYAAATSFKKLGTYFASIPSKKLNKEFQKPQTKNIVKIISSDFQPLCCCNFIQELTKIPCINFW